jgi:hypothetical protein
MPKSNKTWLLAGRLSLFFKTPFWQREKIGGRLGETEKKYLALIMGNKSITLPVMAKIWYQYGRIHFICFVRPCQTPPAS